MNEQEKREKIAEARAFNAANAGRIRDKGPLPELYAGHYEDYFGLAQNAASVVRYPGLHRVLNVTATQGR